MLCLCSISYFMSDCNSARAWKAHREQTQTHSKPISPNLPIIVWVHVLSRTHVHYCVSHSHSGWVWRSPNYRTGHGELVCHVALHPEPAIVCGVLLTGWWRTGLCTVVCPEWYKSVWNLLIHRCFLTLLKHLKLLLIYRLAKTKTAKH